MSPLDAQRIIHKIRIPICPESSLTNKQTIIKTLQTLFRQNGGDVKNKPVAFFLTNTTFELSYLRVRREGRGGGFQWKHFEGSKWENFNNQAFVGRLKMK